MADTNVSAPSFALDRFDLEDDQLVVEGRWFDVRGRRFVRPVLTTEDRRRAIAVLDHKPWVPEDGRPWVAAFRLSGVPSAGRLQVAPDLAIDLPAPGPRAGGGAPQPARVARVEDPSERAVALVVEAAPPSTPEDPPASPEAEPPAEPPPPRSGARARRPRGGHHRSRAATEDWGAPEWTVSGRRDDAVEERPGAAPARPDDGEEAAPLPPGAETAGADTPPAADEDPADRSAGREPPSVPRPPSAEAPGGDGAGTPAPSMKTDDTAVRPGAGEARAADRARAEAAEMTAADRRAHGDAAERVAAEHAVAERARAEAAVEIRELRALLGRAQQALHDLRAERDETVAALRAERDETVATLRAERDEALAEVERLRDADADVRRLREQMQETRAEIEVLGRLARQANERAADAERQRDVLARARERDVARAAEAGAEIDDGPVRPAVRAGEVPERLLRASGRAGATPAGDPAEADPGGDVEEGPVGPPRRVAAPPRGGRRAAAAKHGRGDTRVAGETAPGGDAPDDAERTARATRRDARRRSDTADDATAQDAPRRADTGDAPVAAADDAHAHASGDEDPAAVAATPGPSATRRTIQIGEPPPPGAVPMPPSVFQPPAGAPGGRTDWRLRSLTIIATLLFAAAILALLIGVL